MAFRKPNCKKVTLEVTDKLYIKLLDNGRGIPMELQEKIFVPFFTTKTEEILLMKICLMQPLIMPMPLILPMWMRTTK